MTRTTAAHSRPGSASAEREKEAASEAGTTSGMRANLSRRPALIAAVAVTIVAVVVGVLALAGAFGSRNEGDASRRGVPREVSVQELRDFAGAQSSAVYWAGAIPGRRLELTEAGNNVFVRYLTGEAVVGDGRPAFTTVGTYPFESAYAEVRERGRARGMESRPAPGGGLATWSTERPSSVYLAYPGSEQLVEVYDPDAERARELALSGEVGPVR